MIKKCLENSKMEGIGRCADMIWISFGEKIHTTNFKHEKVEKSEYALHIQCPFRITKEKSVLINNYNVYEVNENVSGEEWDVYGNNKFDKVVQDKIRPMLPLKVLNVKLSQFGDIQIKLEKNVIISIFCNDTEIEEEWRFINHKTHEHYVFREQ